MNHDDLECWCIRAAQWIQDVIDEAQAAAGDKDGEGECVDGRCLLTELDAIIADVTPQKRPQACPTCKGTCANPLSDNVNSLPCSTCDGTGVIAA